MPRLMVIVTLSVAALVGFLSLPCVATAQNLEPYEETLEGTLVTFGMVPVPGGAYEYTNPDTGETEALDLAPFWIGNHEVTWDEYDVYMLHLDKPEAGGSDVQGSGDQTEEANVTDPDAISRPSKPYGSPDLGWGHHGYPAIHITYHAAETYCRWLSLKTGKTYRLPTEPEWEYACRAGVLPAGPIEDVTELGNMAWYQANSDGRTHEVGTKETNAWGMHDMLGNVAEWVAGTARKPWVRGGSYDDAAADVCPAARKQYSMDWQMSDPQIPKSRWWLSDGPFVGFRVVCEAKAAE